MKPSSSHAQFDSKVSRALPPNCKHCSANWLQRWEHSGEQQTNHSQLEKGSGSIPEKFRTRRHLLKRSLIEDYQLRFTLSVYESVDDAVHTSNQTECIERNWYETRGVVGARGAGRQDVTRHSSTVSYQPLFLDCFTLEDWTGRLSRNVA